VEPAGYKHLYIITNNWHMPRTQAIFTTIFSLPATATSPITDSSSASLSSFISSIFQSIHNLCFMCFNVWQIRTETTSSSHHHNIQSSTTSIIIPSSRQLHFLPVSAGITDERLLSLRQEKEKKGLIEFENSVAKEWNSLYDLHVWLFTKHQAYYSERLVPRKTSTTQQQIENEEVLKTY
jgi:hypothetical protein